MEISENPNYGRRRILKLSACLHLPLQVVFILSIISVWFGPTWLPRRSMIPTSAMAQVGWWVTILIIMPLCGPILQAETFNTFS
jgi:hypothetical protein